MLVPVFAFPASHSVAESVSVFSLIFLTVHHPNNNTVFPIQPILIIVIDHLGFPILPVMTALTCSSGIHSVLSFVALSYYAVNALGSTGSMSRRLRLQYS